MVLRFLAVVLVSVSFGIASGAARAQSPDNSDVTRCFVGYYAAAENVATILMNPSRDWSNLDKVDFAKRRDTVAQNLGIASGIYAETLAGYRAQDLTRATVIGPARDVDAAIARLVVCDRLFGFSPAIEPTSDLAKNLLRLQAKATSATAEEIVACARAYSAGSVTPDAARSPVAALWQNADKASFTSREYGLGQQADLDGAFYNVPQSVANKPESETWKGMLPAALQSQDSLAQNAFWREVAWCDALIEIPDPVTAGPLIDPPSRHDDCASYYSAMRVLYQNNPEAARYFHERGVHAARFVRLVGSGKSDQEILADISTLAETHFKKFTGQDGQTDFREIARSFELVATCDRQYGIQMTQMPDDIRQRARSQ